LHCQQETNSWISKGSKEDERRKQARIRTTKTTPPKPHYHCIRKKRNSGPEVVVLAVNRSW
jgi:hypothetical protein